MSKKLPVLAMLGLLILSPGAQATNPAVLLDEYIQACVDLQRFSGSVLVESNGQILITKGYGLANYELDVPNTPQTKFRIGSLTKQFTALAILQLAEKGLLSVADPLSRYLPDYPNGDKITIDHLLTHTSGIADYTASPDSILRTMVPISLENLIASFRDLPPDFGPGEQFAYSNSNYVLLGYLIELITGQSYDDYLSQAILIPLGLTETGSDLGVPLLKNRAAGYMRGPNGLVNALHVELSNLHAAGALYSTAQDLYRWDRALSSTLVVSQASLDEMFTPRLGDYGYGWFIVKLFGRRCAFHGGGVNGFSAFMMRFPDDDTVVIVLANIGSAPVDRMARDLAAIVFGQPYLIPNKKK